MNVTGSVPNQRLTQSCDRSCPCGGVQERKYRMRKLLLASCAVIALGVRGGFAQAQDSASDTSKNSTVSGKGTQAASTSGGESTAVQVDGNTSTKTNSSTTAGANSPAATNHSTATNVSGNTLDV